MHLTVNANIIMFNVLDSKPHREPQLNDANSVTWDDNVSRMKWVRTGAVRVRARGHWPTQSFL